MTVLTQLWTVHSDQGLTGMPNRSLPLVARGRVTLLFLNAHHTKVTSFSTVVHFRKVLYSEIFKRSEVLFVCLTSPSRSHRAKCVPCGPDLWGVRLVGGAYPFPNLPPLLSHRELCPRTAPAHLPAPSQRLPA